MPIEIWMNRPYGTPADVWAVGCLLYELMTYKCATVIWCGKMSDTDPKMHRISAKHFFVVLQSSLRGREHAGPAQCHCGVPIQAGVYGNHIVSRGSVWCDAGCSV
jgi:hypothetical protein